MARIISKCKREKRIDRDRKRQMKRTTKKHTHTHNNLNRDWEEEIERVSTYTHL